LPADVPVQQLELFNMQLLQVEAIPLAGFLPFVERVIAITLHVSLSVIVLQAFTGRKRGFLYVIAAILYHAAVDFVAVVGVRQLESVWLLEGILALTVLPAALWAWRQKPRDQTTSPIASGTLLDGFKLFLAVFFKELRFQWRTRRAIIVLVVFLVFGMMSPLLAKFTPELLSNLEGVEQFAELIPEPTTKDAVAQYISNLTQFGFILVILLGMGAVAGEKEKGTAAMVLSKPLPRWIFLWAKYAAQGFIYLLALFLATISAYYYTLYLFEPLHFSSFIAANLLLYLWFMIYASVTLLGSTLGRTTGAAAGIAALMAVLLLVASTIPKVGALAPGGLVAWAGQLMNSAEIAPNGGSVVMGLVVIILASLAAVAALDEQEI
jgi:ABC-2 type transport system permease protein